MSSIDSSSSIKEDGLAQLSKYIILRKNQN